MSSPTSLSDAMPASSDNRFAVVTEDDHTGIIWVVSVLCLIYTLMILGLRLEARRKNFGWDDALAIVGTAVTSTQYVLIFLANKHGLGRSYHLISDADAVAIGKYMLASQALTLLALGLAKCSVVFLCRRLFTVHQASHRIFCDIGIGACGLWSVASILAVTLDCGPTSLLGYENGFCRNLLTRWVGVGVFDCITELLIVAIAVDGLLPLQMSLGRKCPALATFLLRLVLIVFAVLHMTTLHEATSSTNTGVALAKPTIYLQVELLYALFSASIPALNRWLRNFNTSMGSTWIYGSHAYSFNQSEKSQDRSRSHSVPMVSMDRSGRVADKKRLSILPKRADQAVKACSRSEGFVPTRPTYVTSTETHRHSRISDATAKPDFLGTNSEEMIIRKDVEWQVQHEDVEFVPQTSS